MIKLAGCMFLITASSLIGYMKALTYKDRCRELESVIEIIKLLEIEITYRKETLAKAFHKVSTAGNCSFCKMLKQCSESLERQYSLEASWKSAAASCKAAGTLEKEELTVLQDMMQGLGKSDSESQKKVIEPAIIRLQSILKSAETREQKMGKMYKALGAASGIIIAILII